MDIAVIKICLLTGIILLVLILFLVFVIRREKSKKEIRRMSMCRKVGILNELAAPFGFFYVPEEDVFTSCMDAWQRRYGYQALYDCTAPRFHMVVDALPVYFDYEGRTWLIELWKGQYGINTGGEVGVYHAKEHIPNSFLGAAHFEAPHDAEVPSIVSRLEHRREILYYFTRRHWWLTGFRMGTFSNPKELSLRTTITFCNLEMAQAFYEGLKNTVMPKNNYRICWNEVHVCMDFSPEVCLSKRIHRWFVQKQNHVTCVLYRIITKPFTCTADRMLFLYYQLPFCFRKMFGIGKNRKTRKHIN